MDYCFFQVWHAMIMCTYAFIFFMFGIATQNIDATVHESYLQAHNAYAQENYKAAIVLLSTMPATSFPVLYNLGCAHVKSGNNYEALKAFFKASRIASGFEHVQAYDRYEQMQKKLGLPQVKNKYKDILLRSMGYVPTLPMQIMCFFLLLMTVFFNVYTGKKWLAYTLLVCAVVATAFTYYRYQEKTAVVAFAKLNMVAVHTGPDEQYAVVSQVPQGTEFAIVSTHDLWYCVAFNTQRGWVPVKNLDLMV